MQSDTLQKVSAVVATTPTTPVPAAAATRTVVAAAQPVTEQVLVHRLLAADAATDISDKGPSVSHLLQMLYKSRQLMNSHVQLWVRCVLAANKSKLRGALELAAKTWTPKQEASLRSPNLAKEELMTITSSINTACLLQMRGALELAAKTWTPKQEASLRSPNLAKEELMTITTSIDTACLLQMRLLENKSGTTTGKHKAYFLSLGTRFIKWKAAQPPPSPLKRIAAFFLEVVIKVTCIISCYLVCLCRE
jgi:hypothetical protein